MYLCMYLCIYVSMYLCMCARVCLCGWVGCMIISPIYIQICIWSYPPILNHGVDHPPEPSSIVPACGRTEALN